MATQLPLVLVGGEIKQLPAGDTIAGAPAGGGLPVGGTTNQVLSKASSTDGDAVWRDVLEVSANGTNGQVLRKTTNVSGLYGWQSVAEVPTGGTTHQVLAKNSGVNGDYNWKDGGIPSLRNVVKTQAGITNSVTAVDAVSLTVPANTLVVGDKIRGRMHLTVNNGTTAVTLNLRLRINAVAQKDIAIALGTTAIANRSVSCEFQIVIQSATTFSVSAVAHHNTAVVVANGASSSGRTFAGITAENIFNLQAVMATANANAGFTILRSELELFK